LFLGLNRSICPGIAHDGLGETPFYRQHKIDVTSAAPFSITTVEEAFLPWELEAMCTIHTPAVTEQQRLSRSDIRSIQQIVEGCRDRGDDSAVWMRHFVDRLIVLLNAEGGKGIQIERSGLSGFHKVEHGDKPGDFELSFLTEIDSAILDRVRAQSTVDDDDAVVLLCEGNGAYEGEVRLTALATIAADPNSLQVVTLTRRPGSGCFGQQEVAAMAYAVELLVPLVGRSLAGIRDKRPSNLPPRVRQVLACLLAGNSAKETAKQLGISIFTVNQYATTLFSFYGVQGRVQLMSLWIARGWKPHIVRDAD
jgi:DNA-binding CsgD family transcriptional regulator